MEERLVNVLKVHPQDNVVVALGDLSVGDELVSKEGALHLRARQPIPFGHKVAVVAIPKGQPVIKYGARIGVATRDIAPGEHVHTHNLVSERGVAE